MRLALTAATDAASLLLADPAVLAEGLSPGGQEEISELEALDGAGKVWLMSTGADGGYLMHVYVDEVPPRSVTEASSDPVVIDAFPVPSGRIGFGGAEYGAEFAPSPRLPAHMVTFGTLPAGTYRVTLWRIELPESQLSQEERRRISAGDRFQERLGSLGCLAMALCPIGAAAAFILTPIAAWAQALPWVGGVVLVTGVVGACLYGLPGRRRAAAIRREVRLEGPSIVAWFERVESRDAARNGI